MKTGQINRYLVIAILTLSALPLAASYLLLEEVLDSAISLAIKPQTQALLKDYQNDLKTLRKLDPVNEAEYKQKFLKANDELVVYDQPKLIQQVLRDTYLTYYLVLFVLVLLLSLVVAVILSRKVAKSYKSLSTREIEQAQRLQELSQFDQWQVIAGKLAHEINNPLTPIEMMVSNLPRSYANSAPDAFAGLLDNTKTVVSEEVHKLKAMVSHFSRFSKLPEPSFSLHNLADYCHRFIEQHGQGWPDVRFNQVTEAVSSKTLVKLDHLLFNQALINIVNNAVQANPQQPLKVNLTIKQTALNQVSLVIDNNGQPIEPEHRGNLFKMYFSTKQDKENMGLGLAIVKKIMLDHGGNIECLAQDSGAAFKLTLPISEQDHE
jgi:nitrogen fixation/metabolism regulation signal transduction histidine kinase